MDNVSDVRTTRGTFAPGHSGNPGGRVGLPVDVRAQLEAGAPAAVAKLLELIHSKDDRVALAAAEALLSRLYGKPTLAVDASIKSVSSSDMHLQALKELAELQKQKRLEKSLD